LAGQSLDAIVVQLVDLQIQPNTKGVFSIVAEIDASWQQESYIVDEGRWQLR
jgi:hypothetical protein